MPTVDWVPLASALLRPPRYGVGAAAVPLRAGRPGYIRITDISADGRFTPSPKVGVDHPDAERHRLALGELVVARTGASVGKSYLYNPLDGDLVYAGFLINIAPDPDRLDPRYLALFMQTGTYWNWVARTSVRSGQPGINGRELGALPIPVPALTEQQEVAEVVGDAEVQIKSLEGLIRKNRLVAAGLQQQLLTGRTRLPGFTAAWRERRINDLAEIVSGGTPSSAVPAYWHGAIAWCTPTDITGERTRYLARTSRTISQAGLDASGAQLLPTGSLLLCTRATIGDVKIARVPMATNQGFKSLVPRPGVSGDFLYYLVLTRKDDLVKMGTGSTFLEVSRRDVASLSLLVPELEEQEAIARVLSDAEDDVEALQLRLEKARAVKTGMMQELLTGQARPLLEAAS